MPTLPQIAWVWPLRGLVEVDRCNGVLKLLQSKLPRLLVVSMLIAACFSASSDETRGNYTIWSPEVGGNGHAYEFVATQAYWGEADLNATTRTPPVGFGYGHLVSISDANENEFVTALLGGASWTGFTDREIEGEWRWTDGSSLVWQDPDNFQNPVQTAYTNWSGGEPNDKK